MDLSVISFSSEQWINWKESFETYLDTMKEEMAPRRKLASLKLIGGDELVQLLKDTPALVLDEHEPQPDEYRSAICRIGKYFDEVRSVNGELVVFGKKDTIFCRLKIR